MGFDTLGLIFMGLSIRLNDVIPFWRLATDFDENTVPFYRCQWAWDRERFCNLSLYSGVYWWPSNLWTEGILAICHYVVSGRMVISPMKLFGLFTA